MLVPPFLHSTTHIPTLYLKFLGFAKPPIQNMTSLLSITPTPILPPPPSLTRPGSNPFLLNPTRFGSLSHHRPFLPRTLCVAKFGSGQLPDPEIIKDLFGKAESFLYTVADAAVSASPATETVANSKNNDWFSGISNYMETILKVCMRI